MKTPVLCLVVILSAGPALAQNILLTQNAPARIGEDRRLAQAAGSSVQALSAAPAVVSSAA